MDRDLVVLSSVQRGAVCSGKAQALTVRYVARGVEEFRIAGRYYRLSEGQVMIASQESGSEVEINQRNGIPTQALYALLPHRDATTSWEAMPLVFGSDCNELGRLMANATRSLRYGLQSSKRIAPELIASLRCAVPQVLTSILHQAASVNAGKASTRFESVRKATLAQAVLHSNVHRQLELSELASEVGSSPFALLRAFQQCFGETPALYHRRLRLVRVLEEARQLRMPLSQVALKYGFASASSFCHSYRRTFGGPSRRAAFPLEAATASRCH